VCLVLGVLTVTRQLAAHRSIERLWLCVYMYVCGKAHVSQSSLCGAVALTTVTDRSLWLTKAISLKNPSFAISNNIDYF
jgi:hypothetical protein